MRDVKRKLKQSWFDFADKQYQKQREQGQADLSVQLVRSRWKTRRTKPCEKTLREWLRDMGAACLRPLARPIRSAGDAKLRKQWCDLWGHKPASFWKNLLYIDVVGVQGGTGSQADRDNLLVSRRSWIFNKEQRLRHLKRGMKMKYNGGRGTKILAVMTSDVVKMVLPIQVTWPSERRLGTGKTKKEPGPNQKRTVAGNVEAASTSWCALECARVAKKIAKRYPGKTIVLDNDPVFKSGVAKKAFEDAGLKLLFLPPR
jgi:hypothetical protein